MYKKYEELCILSNEDKLNYFVSLGLESDEAQEVYEVLISDKVDENDKKMFLDGVYQMLNYEEKEKQR